MWFFILGSTLLTGAARTVAPGVVSTALLGGSVFSRSLSAAKLSQHLLLATVFTNIRQRSVYHNLIQRSCRRSRCHLGNPCCHRWRQRCLCSSCSRRSHFRSCCYSSLGRRCSHSLAHLQVGCRLHQLLLVATKGTEQPCQLRVLVASLRYDLFQGSMQQLVLLC